MPISHQDSTTLSYKIEPQELVPGLVYSQRADGIFVFACTLMTNEVVHANFAKGLENDRAAQAANKHIRTMMSLPANWYMNPYLITQAIHSAKETPKGLRESIALVGDGFTLKFMKSVVNRLPPKTSQAVMVFTNESAAVDWLNKRLTYFPEEPYI